MMDSLLYYVVCYSILFVSILYLISEVNSFQLSNIRKYDNNNNIYRYNHFSKSYPIIYKAANTNTYPTDFLKKISYINDIWSLLTVQQSNQMDSIDINTFPYFQSSVIYDYFIECQKIGALSDYEIITNSKENTISLHSKHLLIDTMKESLVINNDEILRDSMKWVQAMISDYSVCPFTSSATKAGIPKGNIYYELSNAMNINDAIKDFWKVTNKMLSSSESDISTVLLIYTNQQLFQDFKHFDKFSKNLDLLFDETNEIYSNSIDFYHYISNVYFHPEYYFKDKDNQILFVFDDMTGDILGTSDEFVEPISYSRRSPYPMVNILRTPMVKAAQRGLPEGKIFYNNKERLDSIGRDQLQQMLDLKDWTLLPKISTYKQLNTQQNNLEYSIINNDNNNGDTANYEEDIHEEEVQNHYEENHNSIDNPRNDDDDEKEGVTSSLSIEDQLLILAEDWLSMRNLEEK